MNDKGLKKLVYMLSVPVMVLVFCTLPGLAQAQFVPSPPPPVVIPIPILLSNTLASTNEVVEGTVPVLSNTVALTNEITTANTALVDVVEGTAPGQHVVGS